ncbi:MAG TPA: amino acid ABC transporter permease, partial [Casimicrobiaceae bacterium]
MDSALHAPIAARPAPVRATGLIAWLRVNLFANWKSTLATLCIGGLVLRWLPDFIDWAIVRAVTRPDNAACRALEHAGACWGVIAEKYRLIIFGRYPFDEQWRPLLATALMVAMLVASCTRILWSRWLVL